MLNSRAAALSTIVIALAPAGAGAQEGPAGAGFYLGLSRWTDPGPFASLYDALPSEPAALLPIVKAQLIHPDADLHQFIDQIPRTRGNEDAMYLDVRAMLKQLVAYDSAGLVAERKPADRLILTCRSAALLMASALKAKGVPARLRYGYATYLLPGLHTYHVVCEVWDASGSRWIRIDPDRQLMEIPEGMYETGGEAWLRYAEGGLDPESYGAPGWTGAHPLVSVLVHDLAAVMNDERDTHEHPAFCATPMLAAALSASQRETLTEAATLLKDVDGNFEAIRELYGRASFLRF